MSAAGRDDRLAPGTEVSRELWLLCGNQCAFPGCGRALLNEHDDWQGEIAHVHGVKPTSARYTAAMSAEDKRKADNLLLLCPNHHGEVDGANGRAAYSAAALRKMKATHEGRFRRAVAAVEQEIGDITLANVVTDCATLAAIRPGWDAVDREYFVPKVNRLAAVLRQLTQPARQLLSWTVAQPDLVGVAEIADRMGISKNRVRELVEQLGRFHLAAIDDQWDEGQPAYPLHLLHTWYHGVGHELFGDWPEFWDDLREHLDGRPDAGVDDVVVGLDFSLLDGPASETESDQRTEAGQQ